MTTQQLGWKAFPTRKIPVKEIAITERIMTPTKSRVDAMVKSLNEIGQLSPIIVTKHETMWRVVTGATRLMAAKELKWDEITATPVTTFNDFECQLIEIAENLARHDLSDAERKKLKAKEKEIRAAKQAHFEEVCAKLEEAEKPKKRTRHDKPTGNKRGRPKGAVSKAAEEAGIPIETVRAQRKRAAISGANSIAPENAEKPNHFYDGLSKGSPPSAPPPAAPIHRSDAAPDACPGRWTWEIAAPEGVWTGLRDAMGDMIRAFEQCLKTLQGNAAESTAARDGMSKAYDALKLKVAHHLKAPAEEVAEDFKVADLDDVPEFLDRTKAREVAGT